MATSAEAHQHSDGLGQAQRLHLVGAEASIAIANAMARCVLSVSLSIETFEWMQHAAVIYTSCPWQRCIPAGSIAVARWAPYPTLHCSFVAQISIYPSGWPRNCKKIDFGRHFACHGPWFQGGMNLTFIPLFGLRNETSDRLFVCQKGITYEGVCRIASGLAKNSSIVMLGIVANPISPDGAAALASALQTNNTVNELDLSSSCIADVGATALADMLMVNKTLEVLKLPSNSIRLAGAQALAVALRHNSTLKVRRDDGSPKCHRPFLPS